VLTDAAIRGARGRLDRFKEKIIIGMIRGAPAFTGTTHEVEAAGGFTAAARAPPRP